MKENLLISWPYGSGVSTQRRLDDDQGAGHFGVGRAIVMLGPINCIRSMRSTGQESAFSVENPLNGHKSENQRLL